MTRYSDSRRGARGISIGTSLSALSLMGLSWAAPPVAGAWLLVATGWLMVWALAWAALDALFGWAERKTDDPTRVEQRS